MHARATLNWLDWAEGEIYMAQRLASQPRSALYRAVKRARTVELRKRLQSVVDALRRGADISDPLLYVAWMTEAPMSFFFDPERTTFH